MLFLLVFNDSCKNMKNCGAGVLCQLYHGIEMELESVRNISLQCDFCLQWYHEECVTFELNTTWGEEAWYCGCHKEDHWGYTEYVHEYFPLRPDS